LRHAASDALQGGLSNDSHSDWTIQDSVLSDAHGADLSLHNGSSLRVLRNDISRGGDMGIHGTLVNDSLIQGNRIHDNALDQFSPKWGAGGAKLTEVHGFVFDANEVDHNRAEGLWCDVKCANVTYSANRVHDNQWEGIVFEVSDGASIHDNVVWQNGWSRTDWAWGAGILVSSAAHAEIFNNTLAWNYAGISIVSQKRPDGILPVGNFVHDNTIVRTTVNGDFSKTFWENL